MYPLLYHTTLSYQIVVPSEICTQFLHLSFSFPLHLVIAVFRLADGTFRKLIVLEEPAYIPSDVLQTLTIVFIVFLFLFFLCLIVGFVAYFLFYKLDFSSLRETWSNLFAPAPSPAPASAPTHVADKDAKVDTPDCGVTSENTVALLENDTPEPPSPANVKTEC